MKLFFLQHFHLSVLFLCIFSCVLVPAGVCLVARGYQLLQQSFSGPLLLEIPLTAASGEFLIPKEGVYAIWQKGTLVRRRPLKPLRPHIYAASTQNSLPLIPSPPQRINLCTLNRTEIYTFEALAGRHKMVVEPDLPPAKPDASRKGAFPLPANFKSQFLQIREIQAGRRYLLSVPMMFAGVLVTTGGFLLISVVEWLANQ